MPELPEVETIVRDLNSLILGECIEAIEFSGKSLRIPYQIGAQELIRNHRIVGITRRAKYVLLCLMAYRKDNNDINLRMSMLDIGSNARLSVIIAIHLGMSGRLYIQTMPFALTKHDHVALYLSSGKMLILNDARRFSSVSFMKRDVFAQHDAFIRLGVEPLSKEFDATFLHKHLATKRVSIKSAIMDARIVVGIGNIYANESLFAAKIEPLQPSYTMDLELCTRLVKCIKYTLEKAIKERGSTLRDYRTAYGQTGNFQNHFMVYGRANQNCYTCSSKIMRIKMLGRSTFYCPQCQNRKNLLQC